MKLETFTIQDLRLRKWAAEHVDGRLCHLPRRRKVNCYCRCTPSEGIVALYPDFAREVYDDQLHYLLDSENPGHIADRAMQVGQLLFVCGRPLLALTLMKAALNHLIWVDDNLQEDYARNHYYPGWRFAQWYHPWSARVSEVDARLLGACIDRLVSGHVPLDLRVLIDADVVHFIDHGECGVVDLAAASSDGQVQQDVLPEAGAVVAERVEPSLAGGFGL